MKYFLRIYFLGLLLSFLSCSAVQDVNRNNMSSSISNIIIHSDYTYSIINGNQLEITGYSGNGGNIAVPSEIDGKTVVSIGSNAFRNNLNISNITMPDTITNIGDYAFQLACIYGVDLGKSVITIGVCAFNCCWNLASVSVPDKVLLLCDPINGPNLTNIDIGKSVTNIWLMQGCPNLVSINVSGDNQYYSSQDGVLFDKNKEHLVQFPSGINGVYTIPGSVVSIDVGAFISSGLSSISIPNSVKSIESSAFFGCRFAELNLPSSVTSIQFQAIEACTNLTAINVDTGNESYKSQNGVLFNKNMTALVQYPSGLTGSYFVPASVTNIGDNAFGYSGLASIIMPVSVVHLGYIAFEECSHLTNIILSNKNCAIPHISVFNNVSSNFQICAPGGGSVEGFCLSNNINFKAL
jgi:hypothetical protein